MRAALRAVLGKSRLRGAVGMLICENLDIFKWRMSTLIDNFRPLLGLVQAEGSLRSSIVWVPI